MVVVILVIVVTSNSSNGGSSSAAVIMVVTADVDIVRRVDLPIYDTTMIQTHTWSPCTLFPSLFHPSFPLIPSLSLSASLSSLRKHSMERPTTSLYCLRLLSLLVESLCETLLGKPMLWVLVAAVYASSIFSRVVFLSRSSSNWAICWACLRPSSVAILGLCVWCPSRSMRCRNSCSREVNRRWTAYALITVDPIAAQWVYLYFQNMMFTKSGHWDTSLTVVLQLFRRWPVALNRQ